jgi:hypothetical protein
MRESGSKVGSEVANQSPKTTQYTTKIDCKTKKEQK